MALVFFADLSLLRQIFPHIDHKLVISKKVVPDFRHGGKIFTVIGKYFPLLKLRHFDTNKISKNRQVKYDIFLS